MELKLVCTEDDFIGRMLNVATNVLIFITDRFYTIFENSENEGHYAASRMDLWRSGILLPPQRFSSDEVR